MPVLVDVAKGLRSRLTALSKDDASDGTAHTLASLSPEPSTGRTWDEASQSSGEDADTGAVDDGHLKACPSDTWEGVFALAPETTVPCHRGTAMPAGTTRLRNRWREVAGSDVAVRGPSYLVDSKKQPSAPSAFRVVGLDVLHTRGVDGKVERVYGVGDRPGGFVDRYRKAAGAAAPFILLFNYILPWGNLLIYAVPSHGGSSPYTGVNPVLDNLLKEFLESPTAAAGGGEATAAAAADAIRNNRLKMVPRCNDGPRIIRRVVTGKPAITGTKIEHKYFSGEGYFEVVFNICSSKATSSIFALCNGMTQSVEIDMGFVLEGKTAAELPEHLLTAIRFYRLETASGVRRMKDWEERP